MRVGIVVKLYVVLGVETVRFDRRIKSFWSSVVVLRTIWDWRRGLG